MQEKTVPLKVAIKGENHGECSFVLCKRVIEPNHTFITVSGKPYHTRCYGEHERMIGVDRAQAGITRKQIRASDRVLRKAILNKQVCKYFPIPFEPVCGAGSELSGVFSCTKTFAKTCEAFIEETK